MKTLHEFQALRMELTPEQHLKKYPNSSPIIDWDEEYINSVELFYDYDGYYIEKLKNGSIILNVERSSYLGELEELEQCLWDWAKFQYGIDTDDLEEDMHERSREWLDENGFSCSLDEIDIEEYREFLIRTNNPLVEPIIKQWRYLIEEWKHFQ